MPPKEHWNMGKRTKHIEWNGAKQQEAIDLLLGKGNITPENDSNEILTP